MHDSTWARAMSQRHFIRRKPTQNLRKLKKSFKPNGKKGEIEREEWSICWLTLDFHLNLALILCTKLKEHLLYIVMTVQSNSNCNYNNDDNHSLWCSRPDTSLCQLLINLFFGQKLYFQLVFVGSCHWNTLHTVRLWSNEWKQQRSIRNLIISYDENYSIFSKYLYRKVYIQFVQVEFKSNERWMKKATQKIAHTHTHSS